MASLLRRLKTRSFTQLRRSFGEDRRAVVLGTVVGVAAGGLIGVAFGLATRPPAPRPGPAATVVATSVPGPRAAPAGADGGGGDASPVPLSPEVAAEIEAKMKAASGDVRLVHAAVLRDGDHGRAPFVIVDKRGARLWVYDGVGRPLGHAPVLLGSARGDHTVPGVGDKPPEAIRPEERTTPAGRFVAASGMSLRGEQVWWVDYEAALSMHRVLTTRPTERRQQRLATQSIADNRISAGCINLPRPFYETVLHPALAGTRPVVYILPETREVRAWLAEMQSARAEARAALERDRQRRAVARATPR